MRGAFERLASGRIAKEKSDGEINSDIRRTIFKFNKSKNLHLLNGFDNFSGFDAACANLHPPVVAVIQTNTDGLQVWFKAATSTVVGVRDVISKLRTFSANFTAFCHNLLLPPNYYLTG